MENMQITKQKIKQLNEMMEILNKNTNDYQKALELSEYYTSVKVYEKSFSSLKRKAIKDNNLSKLIPIIERIKSTIEKYENNDIFSKVNYFQNHIYYFENYKYSEFVINYYINSKSNDLFDICESIGINETNFNTCLTIVKELNPILYNEYQKKSEEKLMNRYETIKKQIFYLYNQIKMAKENNEVYPKFDFLINMPFSKKEKSHHLFYELQKINPQIKSIPNTIFGKIVAFTEAEMPEKLPVIKEYMMKNGLYRIPEFTKKELKKTYLLDTYRVKNENGSDVFLSKEKINSIINYMEANNYPFIIEIFIELQKKYVDNELNLDNSKDILTKTLIP